MVFCARPSNTLNIYFLFPKTFCCVDKGGVLSYPNLTPAKVFVFKSMFSEEQIIEKQKSHEMLTETENAAKMRKSLDVPDDEGI